MTSQLRLFSDLFSDQKFAPLSPWKFETSPGARHPPASCSRPSCAKGSYHRCPWSPPGLHAWVGHKNPIKTHHQRWEKCTHLWWILGLMKLGLPHCTRRYLKIPEDTWRYLKGPESPFWGFYPDPVTIETCQQDLIKYSVACWLSRPRADGWPDPNLTNGDVQFFKKDGKKSATNRCLWKWVVPWYPKKLTFMVEKYVRNMDFRQIPMTMCARSVFPSIWGQKSGSWVNRSTSPVSGGLVQSLHWEAVSLEVTLTSKKWLRNCRNWKEFLGSFRIVHSS